MDWSYNEKDRRQMERTLDDPSRNKTSSRQASDQMVELFIARMNQLNSQLVTSNGYGPHERRRRSSIKYCE
ncbi:unnamed protein product [Strongylus vulgaris]|uniref:Uncharacterized protein n=1 Tax=Strongylus vulgaris TaxID=40348 RepID=A0A3P7KNE1_STRVU|nr:unnamed protein product [Strongylus vulgaris]